MGWITSNNMLFYPQLPSLQNCPDEETVVIQGGFRLDPNTKKREKIDFSQGRLRSYAIVYFALHLEDAYIGRLLLLLRAYTKLGHHQNLPQVLFYLLEIAGPDLNRVYGRAFRNEVAKLRQDYLPAARKQLLPDSRPSMYDEPQNKLKYLTVDAEDLAKIEKGGRPSKEDTGIYDVEFYVNRLEKKINEILQM